jgi:hypothetical protein
MPIKYTQIISTLNQRQNTIDLAPVFMDQNDEISGIEYSTEHPADIKIT